MNGTDAIANKWVKLAAAILEPIETQRSSFALRDRTITAGMSALLYFQQETAPVGYDNADKPLT